MAFRLKLQGRFIFTTIIVLGIFVVINTFALMLIYEYQGSEMVGRVTSNSSRILFTQLKKRADSLAAYLAPALFNSLYSFNPQGAYELLQPVLELDEVIAVTVVDAQGNIFHDGQETIKDFGLPYKGEERMDEVVKKGSSYIRMTEDLMIVAQPIQVKGDLIGALFISFTLRELSADVDSMTTLINRINLESRKKAILVTVISTGLILVLGVIVIFLLVRSMVKPLLQLIEHARQIGEGEFKPVQGIERYDEVGELVNAFNTMVRQIKTRTDKISYLAYHDTLTDLPNRSRFLMHIDNLIADSSIEGLVVLFIDLDEFKVINDNFGHKAGDNVLVGIAKRLKRILRSDDLIVKLSADEEGDKVVARIGGDEFLICLPNVKEPGEADAVVERIIKTIGEPVEIGSEKVVIGCSVGVAHYPESGRCSDELVKNADIAMYHSKSIGKNTFSHFSSDMNAQVEKRARTERELRKALDDPSQFVFWYQPQVDMKTNQVIGAEALIRWNHPEQGLIMPSEFISIAEDTGMIIPIGKSLISSLCSQLHTWRTVLTSDFKVSLNLSSKQIYRQNMAGFIMDQMSRFDIPFSRMNVEITESLLMKDEQEAATMLAILQKNGIKIWLDDFGTGYSSLSYLRRFQVDGIKIDRSFIMDIEHEPQDQTLSEAIISMARKMKISVIAEGVEKKAQADFLVSKKCRLGQGYLYGRPMPAKELEELFLKPALPAEDIQSVAN